MALNQIGLWSGSGREQSSEHPPTSHDALALASQFRRYQDTVSRLPPSPLLDKAAEILGRLAELARAQASELDLASTSMNGPVSSSSYKSIFHANLPTKATTAPDETIKPRAPGLGSGN